jgi:eukaryotic-like serine/threonine-protein kinase
MSVVYNVAMNEVSGKYRNLLELGEGGTAHVYLAVAHGMSGFNKLVVMKTLKQNLVADPEYHQMFLTEARLAARLNHPNIVQTNEVTEGGGIPSIVMEYLEGQPLSAIVARARGKFPLGMHLKVVLEALAGLHYAHELRDYDGTPLRLVHRDVTPHNIFVTFEGQIKVLDFGIAKVATAGAQTQEGVLKGKIRYMAPEQIVGDPIDRRADIFSVGVMLWEAAVGERMWKGQSDATVMNNVLNGEIPPIASLRPDVHPELDRVCCRALAHNPQDRHATAADLEADLEKIIPLLGPNGLISNREIGKFVSELFADLRRETRAVIDNQLKRIGSLSWDEYRDNSFTPPPLAPFTQKTVTTSAASMLERSNLRGVREGAKRYSWMLFALGLLLVLVLFRGLVSARSGPSPAASPVAVTSPPPPPPPPAPRAESVTIRLQASPPEATLFFDGNALPSNPYAGSLPKDHGRHTIRAEAQGYGTKSDDVILDKDTDYTFALERTKKADRGRGQASQPPAPTARTTATTTRAPTTSAPANNCAVPFFVDDRGIKRVKPECM